MTQKSYFWGGTSVGDATLAPYDDDEFSDFIMAAIQYRREVQGVIFGKDNNLEVTNPSGLTIQVDTGRAFVDGKLYVNDVAEDLTLSAAPVSGTDYYHVVLRKAFSAQTVRLALVGPVNGGPATPAVQNDGVTWEILLAEVRQTSGGTITIYDRRVPVNYIGCIFQEEGSNFDAISKTISDLPSYVKHYKLEILMRGDLGGAASRGIDLRFNGDTGNNFTDHAWRFRDTGVSDEASSTGRDSIRLFGFHYESADALMTKIVVDILQDGLGYATVSFEAFGGETPFMVFAKGNGAWKSANVLTSMTILETTEAVALQTEYYKISLYAVP